MTQAVNDYIENIKQPWQIEIAKRLRETIVQAMPDVEEKIQYGKPHFKRNGQYAAVLGTAKGWVTLTIFNATALEAEEGFFEDGPPERKTVKILEGQSVDYDRIGKLLQQAAATL